MIVSDKAVDIVLSESLLSREKFRALKSFDKKQMERYITNIYKSGFEDGYELAENQVFSDEVKVDWEDVLQVIASIPGIGKKTLQKIDAVARERFEHDTRRTEQVG